MAACHTKGLADLLKKMKVGLAICEKSLFQYLETKRKRFPRFYFLSNASLLDMLSNGHDARLVQVCCAVYVHTIEDAH